MENAKWKLNWKMLFNTDPSKPAPEILFSRKNQIQNHPTISLKELQSYKSYFCVCHKNRQKHNQHFNTALFHNKIALCHIKSTIYR